LWLCNIACTRVVNNGVRVSRFCARGQDAQCGGEFDREGGLAGPQISGGSRVPGLGKVIFNSGAHNVSELQQRPGCAFGPAFGVNLPGPSERRPAGMGGSDCKSILFSKVQNRSPVRSMGEISGSGIPTEPGLDSGHRRQVATFQRPRPPNHRSRCGRPQRKRATRQSPQDGGVRDAWLDGRLGR
jgi:hypothetical protein